MATPPQLGPPTAALGQSDHRPFGTRLQPLHLLQRDTSKGATGVNSEPFHPKQWGEAGKKGRRGDG